MDVIFMAIMLFLLIFLFLLMTLIAFIPRMMRYGLERRQLMDSEKIAEIFLPLQEAAYRSGYEDAVAGRVNRADDLKRTHGELQEAVRSVRNSLFPGSN